MAASLPIRCDPSAGGTAKTRSHHHCPPRNVASQFLRPLRRALRQTGTNPSVPFAPTVDEQGLTREWLTDAEAESVWRTSERFSGDAAIGLRTATMLRPGDFGALDFAALTSSSVGTALDVIRRFFCLIDRGGELRVQWGRTTATIGYDRPGLASPLTPPAVDFLGAMTVMVARKLIGEPIVPLATQLPRPAPTDRMFHGELFGPNLQFSAPAIRVVLSREVLDRPLLQSDPALCALLQRYLEELVSEVESTCRWSRKVERAAMELMPRGALDLDSVARKLGTSRGTLRRRLAAEGTGYRELLDGVRRKVALARLAREDTSTAAEVAALVGFSEPAAFHRAFRRWMGTTPRQYQALQRQAAPARTRRS